MWYSCRPLSRFSQLSLTRAPDAGTARPKSNPDMVPRALAVLFGATLLSGALCADRSMMTQYGVGSYDSLAVCNDGSTYNYFYRPGVGAASNT